MNNELLYFKLAYESFKLPKNVVFTSYEWLGSLFNLYDIGQEKNTLDTNLMCRHYNIKTFFNYSNLFFLSNCLKSIGSPYTVETVWFFIYLSNIKCFKLPSSFGIIKL